MKSKYFLFAATLLFAACSQEFESDNLTVSQPGVLTGTFEQIVVEDEAQTKAAFDNSYNFMWEDGDMIRVLLTNGSSKNYMISEGVGTSKGKFAGSLLAGEELSDKVAYPKECELTSSGVSYTLPSTYSYGSPKAMYNGSDPSLVLPCWAQIVGDDFTMKYLTGFFLFEISEIPAGSDKFELYITNGKRVNGTFSANFADEEPKFITEDASNKAEQTITITFAASTEVTKRAFIIPVPAGSYTYEWYMRADGKLNGFGYVESPITVNRGKIKVKRAACSSIGASTKTIAFADDEFKAFCVDKFDKDKDGEVSLTEAEKVTSIDCPYREISSLEGVEYFVNLTTLQCYGNQLTKLDVSKNTVLTDLKCDGNKLISLNVSGCTELTSLNCYKNQLANLNVSGCTALTSLTCNSNQLTSLNVSNNTALTSLTCFENQLTSLDVSKITKLKSLSCWGNLLYRLDVSGCTELTFLDCSWFNKLTSLDISNNTKLTKLDCSNNQLKSLDVSNNTALTELKCNGNQMTSLDVSYITALTKLYCYDNLLTSLDVSNNTELTILSCGSNQLISLDVSNNTALTELYCGCSTMTTLYLAEGQEIETLSKNVNTEIVYK